MPRKANRTSFKPGDSRLVKGTDRLLSHGRLTERQYGERIRSQDGKCAICGRIPSYKLRVDHDHHTNQVRQLLCQKCNLALGYFDDSPERMRLAAAYVEKHRAG